MYADLATQEKERESMFARELAERETDCIVDRALLKARNAKELGTLSAPEYHRIREKVDSLKKLKFVEEYEFMQDKQMYEWIKYKVAADIGGQEEAEALHLYEKIKIDELGQTKWRMLREQVKEI